MTLGMDKINKNYILYEARSQAVFRRSWGPLSNSWLTGLLVQYKDLKMRCSSGPEVSGVLRLSWWCWGPQCCTQWYLWLKEPCGAGSQRLGVCEVFTLITILSLSPPNYLFYCYRKYPILKEKSKQKNLQPDLTILDFC